MLRHNMVKSFESRQGHLEYRVKQDYIRNGVVTIPCNISSYNDVISPYSVKDFETINQDFFDYIKTAAEMTPDEYPIVLNIIGNCLSQEEKERVKEVIQDNMGYNLGIVEKEEKRHTKIFIGMFVGLLISGVLLCLSKVLEDEPREIFFILFWFMGDTLCDYIFLTGHDLRKDRRLAGRLASIKVVFSDKYEDMNYTDGDVNRLYSEIEKDVNKTIRDEEEE